jgi:spore coat protein H
VDDDARFYGLKQLNFHSMNFDPAQLRDRLGYALYREAGVAAPRAMHARVLINGKLEGLFIAVEAVDGRFTRGRFTEGGKGNLYKEVWPVYSTPDVYERALETNVHAPVVDKMVAFKEAVDQGSAAIGSWLDRDYMLRYFAVDRVIENDDGVFHWYCKAGIKPEADIWNHNFFWYEAEHAQRMWLVPWDLDNSFAGHPYVHIATAWNTAEPVCICWGSPAQRPASCDPLTAEFARWNADYQKAVAAFISGPFAADRVTAKLDAWSKQIRKAVEEAGGIGGAPLAPVWDLAVAGLRDTIARERAHQGFAY